MIIHDKFNPPRHPQRVDPKTTQMARPKHRDLAAAPPAFLQAPPRFRPIIREGAGITLAQRFLRLKIFRGENPGRPPPYS